MQGKIAKSLGEEHIGIVIDEMTMTFPSVAKNALMTEGTEPDMTACMT